YELRITSYELRVTNYELRITNYELRITNYELRITNYELRITSYELRVTNYELRVTSYELRIKTMIGIQFEGNLLTPDITTELLTGNIKGQTPSDFGLSKTDKLEDEIAIAWG
ncbi:hypothetical protein FHL01_12505, partial [Cylindrospermopsis raciborskii CS-506_C]|nr:hypothetical protein [Cylindrospermopsis raciborskii CS-506_C]